MKTRLSMMIVASLVLTMSASALTHDWDKGAGADTSWANATNWNNADTTTPSGTDSAVFSGEGSADVADVNSDVGTCGSLYMGYDRGVGSTKIATININSGGTVTPIYAAFMGFASSSLATINVKAGGTLDASDAYAGTYIGYGNAGTGFLNQTGGSVLMEKVILGRDTDSQGTYQISGGSLSVVANYTGTAGSSCPNESFTLGSDGGYGTFKVIGNAATISIDAFYEQKTNGTLVADIGAGAISLINVTSNATITGDLEILESGAALGTYDILTTEGTLSGDFINVTVNGTDIDTLADWSYSVAGDTVSVTVIPEPATMGLFGLAGLGLLVARRIRG